jgi:exodeoxyribonuclease VII large subunit
MSQPTFLEKLMQERKALSVSELTRKIKTLIEGRFFDVWVEGEISNFRLHSSGHWYFSLKDSHSMVRCASFRMQNRFIRFSPEDGLNVRARGKLSVYEGRGEYQLLIEHMEPVGAGSLQAAFEQIKQKLLEEGLFDPSRKRLLPLLPRCVGVVTSPNGAALRDILRVLRRRNDAVDVLIAPARVQGPGASREIANGIEALSSREEVDVILVARGGGSAEDLWSFNEESVARAIHKARVPVISAVGHETDFTLADLVADLRASTPSAAAELVCIARDQLVARLRGLREDLNSSTRYRLLELRNRLSNLAGSRAFDDAANQIRFLSQRIDWATYSMEKAVRQRLRITQVSYQRLSDQLGVADIRHVMSEQRARLTRLDGRLATGGRSAIENLRKVFTVVVAKLDSLSPLGVLSRGYAIAFDPDGRVLRRATDVSSGDRVRVRLAEGEIDCVSE